MTIAIPRSGRRINWETTLTLFAILVATCTGCGNPQPAVTRNDSALQLASQSVQVKPLFWDDFDSGSLKRGRWEKPGVNVSVESTRPHSGTHSLRFRYRGKPDICADATAEQRFTLPQLKEVWIEYWFYVPTNFAHRRPAGCRSNAANQKLIRVWGPSQNGYGKNNPKAGASFDPIKSRPDSYVYLQWGDANNTIKAGQERGSVWGDAFTDAVRGRWLRLRWHFRLASGPEASDGAVRLWVDDVLKVNLADKPFFGTNGNWFSTGYLMGWANSSYGETTDFYIDDFKIYDRDPGW